jgi:type II secretory pathway pseudopilin PulG
MRSRSGFALPAVLAALVVMAMLVAVAAQRALVAVRDSALTEARVQLAAATQTAAAEVLARAPDTLALGAAPPGAAVDSGRCRVGSAEAAWRVTAVRSPLVLLAIDASSPVRGGVARIATHIWLRRRFSSAGTPEWSLAGTGWWVQIPSS